MITPNELFRLFSNNSRKWCAALIALCSLIAFSSNAAYADPDFTQVNGGTSSDTPGLAFLKGFPVMMARANDNTNALWYSINRGPWKRVPTGTTLAAPALITWNSTVLAITTGEDGNFWTMPMSNASGASSTWEFNTSWEKIPGTAGQIKTNLRPTAVAGPFDSIDVFATYNNETINTTATAAGSGTVAGATPVWSGEFRELPGNGFTESSVSAALGNNIITTFQTGTDHKLYAASHDVFTRAESPNWVQVSGLVVPGALTFGTAASNIDSNGDIAVCGVNEDALRMFCAQVTVTENPSSGSTPFSYKLGTSKELNVPNTPAMRHSPTLAFDTGSTMAVAATFSNPSADAPDVWLSAIKSFSAITTSGQWCGSYS